MTLEDLGNIGEFIGAIAVVGSLVYLAIQIRQNTRSNRASAYQNHAATRIQVALAVASSKERSMVTRLGLYNPESLDSDQGLMFQGGLLAEFWMWQDSFRLWRDGIISDTDWEVDASFIRGYKLRPGFVIWWENNGRYFDPEFQNVVNELDETKETDTWTLMNARD